MGLQRVGWTEVTEHARTHERWEGPFLLVPKFSTTIATQWLGKFGFALMIPDYFLGYSAGFQVQVLE